ARLRVGRVLVLTRDNADRALDRRPSAARPARLSRPVQMPWPPRLRRRLLIRGYGLPNPMELDKLVSAQCEEERRMARINVSDAATAKWIRGAEMATPEIEATLNEGEANSLINIHVEGDDDTPQLFEVKLPPGTPQRVHAHEHD